MQFLFLKAITSSAGAPVPINSCLSLDLFFCHSFSELVCLEPDLELLVFFQVITNGIWCEREAGVDL